MYRFFLFYWFFFLSPYSLSTPYLSVPFPLSLLSQTEWLIWYAIESDYIMQFSLIREKRNNYFLSPYLLREAVFLKGELASLARYHYSFWWEAFTTDYIFWAQKFHTNGQQ